MSENAVSAFSIYTTLKRKSTEQLLNSKKKKKNQLLRNKATKQKIVAKHITQENRRKRHVKHKRTLNVAMKSKSGVVTKSGNLRIFKNNLPATKKAQFVQNKNNIDEMQQLNATNNVQSVHKKSKLKKKNSKVKSKMEKEKSEMSFNKRKTKVSSTGNRKKQGSDSSNHMNDCKYVKCDNLDDPIVSSRKLFEWLIHPLKVEDFFAENWENTPVHIKGRDPNYYGHLMSTPLLDKVLREQDIFFSKNIDITSYSYGKRETHNPPGRALPSVVWDYYQNDCSVRMLNPQTFIPQLHALNATLQEFFGCFVGANSYLTPPNSQGFAPHYDDIEAFILQLEGKKRWRLYKPLNAEEYLARYSSRNFDQSEIGTPILDAVVNAGDLLYFPRGTIHQGITVDDTHSLHVTLSVYQRNSWCDLLEKLLPRALQQATATDSRFREGLPLNYLRCIGTAYAHDNPKKTFKDQLKDLLTRLIDFVDVDSAADLMAKNHIHDFLPPVLSEAERKCSVAEDGDVMVANGIVKNCVGFALDTRVRLTRSHCIRLIEEYDTCKIYYSTENSKDYHEYELQFLEVEERFVPGIRSIINAYPKFVCVNELPIDDDNEKIQIVRDLWEKALVITDVPLGSHCEMKQKKSRSETKCMCI